MLISALSSCCCDLFRVRVWDLPGPQQPAALSARALRGSGQASRRAACTPTAPGDHRCPWGQPCALQAQTMNPQACAQVAASSEDAGEDYLCLPGSSWATRQGTSIQPTAAGRQEGRLFQGQLLCALSVHGLTLLQRLPQPAGPTETCCAPSVPLLRSWGLLLSCWRGSPPPCQRAGRGVGRQQGKCLYEAANGWEHSPISPERAGALRSLFFTKPFTFSVSFAVI